MFNLTVNTFEQMFGLPEIIAYVFIGAIGAAIGSFLNVVIHRVPREQSVVRPNSACPHCGKPIRSYDNIPILSWLLLAGKCRNCGSRIAWRYPAVELLTSLLFLLTYSQIGFSPFLPVGLCFVAVMVALVFIDAEHMILPNVITYPLFIISIVIRITFPLLLAGGYFPDAAAYPLGLLAGYPPWLISFIGAILGALVGGGSLWLVGEVWKRLRGVDAMGLGDVKMMLGVGALLGWRLAILSIFLGAFSGALAGSIVILRQKERDLQAQIPFGIFLGIGSIVALLFGEKLISWYLNTFIA
jgi:leader peptidase (prepilin peptidase) / N-methyltransferase